MCDHVRECPSADGGDFMFLYFAGDFIPTCSPCVFSPGGFDGTTYYQGVWAFDLTQLTTVDSPWLGTQWIPVINETATDCPRPRAGHSLSVYEDRMYLVRAHSAVVARAQTVACPRAPHTAPAHHTATTPTHHHARTHAHPFARARARALSLNDHPHITHTTHNSTSTTSRGDE